VCGLKDVTSDGDKLLDGQFTGRIEHSVSADTKQQTQLRRESLKENTEPFFISLPNIEKFSIFFSPANSAENLGESNHKRLHHTLKKLLH